MVYATTVHRLQPFSTNAMSLTASLLSGYNTIEERRVKEKCKEHRIGKIKSIGRYTVWKFTSYTTFFSQAESCRAPSFGEHSLPVLLPFHKQTNGPLNNTFARFSWSTGSLRDCENPWRHLMVRKAITYLELNTNQLLTSFTSCNLSWCDQTRNDAIVQGCKQLNGEKVKLCFTHVNTPLNKQHHAC